jgi:hypothetical protein
MGIFDSLTGKPAKKAAEENIGRLNAFKTEGMGYLDTGRTGALDSLTAAGDVYRPLQAKYGAGSNMYLDSLGLNGADGNARATGAFQAGPGYDFKVNQSLDALDRRAASRGLLGSGNNTIDTLSTVHGIANQEYGDWQNRLAGLISPEMSAAAGVAGSESAKAPVWTNDANARLGLGQNVVSGVNDQTTQKANAEMAASKNMLGLGMSLASLAAGGMPGLGGITGMLGGSAGGAGMGSFLKGSGTGYLY